jgi:ABC-type uncharacterized transport system substrate-binding protein
MTSTVKACSRAYGVAIKRVNPNEVYGSKNEQSNNKDTIETNGDSLKKMYAK